MTALHGVACKTTTAATLLFWHQEMAMNCLFDTELLLHNCMQLETVKN